MTKTIPSPAAAPIDEARLDAWLAEHIADHRGPLALERFSGGQSNPTYRVTTPVRNYVLRRKPPGDLLKGAHAIDREYRVIEALGRVNFPVPHLYGLCTDDAVIGSWFYVMDMVEGRIFWNPAFPELSAAERPLYFDAMNETIARLHSIDPVAIGLGDFGRPGNYFARQIARWSRQYLQDDAAGRDASMDRLVEWLPLNIPAGDETSIVHGDCRADNMIFHPSEPRVIAVLDWELSTLGHALADFTYNAMMYRMPPSITSGLAETDLVAANIPSEADYVAAYCRRTGRDGIANYDFYIAFNMFRFAAILHGIKARAIRGTAASAQARDMAANFELLAQLGWAQAERAMLGQ